MTPSGRNTGAETSIFKSGYLPDGVAAAEPNGKKYDAFKDPALNRGGHAEAFHERMNRADDAVAPWDQDIADSYDETCGMASRQEFARELLMAVFDDFLEMDIEINGWPVVRRGDAYTSQWDCRTIGFNSAAHIFLASLGVHRLHNNSRAIVRIQDLQSPSEVLTDKAIAAALEKKGTENIADLVTDINHALISDHWKERVNEYGVVTLVDGCWLRKGKSGDIHLEAIELIEGVVVQTVGPDGVPFTTVNRGQIIEWLGKRKRTKGKPYYAGRPFAAKTSAPIGSHLIGAA